MKNKTIKLLLFVLVSFVGIYVFAEEAEALHHEAGIPKVVYYQALNFFGLLAIFHFLIRKRIVGFFNKRHEEISTAVNESRRLKSEVEKKHEEYTIKLQALENDSKATLNKIKQEGEDAKLRIIEEAQKAAATIEKETQKRIELEIIKAKKILFEDTLDKSLEGARGILEKSVAADDHKRLQKEFLGKIGAMK